MNSPRPDLPGLIIHPLTADRWNDLSALFGEQGACAGCWCMWWRLMPKKYRQNSGVDNQAALKVLVDAEEVPGLLAYSGEQPTGWCSVAPREAFLRIPRRSR